VCSFFVCFVLFFVKMRRQVRVQCFLCVCVLCTVFCKDEKAGACAVFFVCVLFPVFCKDEKAGACAVFCVCALYCFL